MTLVHWHERGTFTQTPREVVGNKAFGLMGMADCGLAVPPGFTIGTDVCRAYLAGTLDLTHLAASVQAAIRDLAWATGHDGRALKVAVRSGSSVSMPGMMDTVLDVEGHEALGLAIRAVFDSWNSPRAVAYREANGIPHDLGTAVTVQAMVDGRYTPPGAGPATGFGLSGSGVMFTRDPNTGDHHIMGEWLEDATGEDLVGGVRAGFDLRELRNALYVELLDAARTLERYWHDAQDVEFVIENDKLWFLQTRALQTTAKAGVRIAVDLAKDLVITKDVALARCGPRLRGLERPVVDPEWAQTAAAQARIVARGVGASPGVKTAQAVTSREMARRVYSEGHGNDFIFVRPDTTPADYEYMSWSSGLLTLRGGLTSHAALTARQLGLPCVVAAEGLRLASEDLSEPLGKLDPRRACAVIRQPMLETVGPDGGARTLSSHFRAVGPTLTIDGDSGLVYEGHAPVTNPKPFPELTELLSWRAERHASAPDAPKGTALELPLGAARALIDDTRAFLATLDKPKGST